VRQDDRLQLALCRVAVLAGQDVDFALVHAKLANVGVEEKNVCTLHAGIKDLGGGQVVRVGAAHDLRKVNKERRRAWA